MSTQPATIERLLSHLEGLGAVRCKRMFGEAALYLDEKVVALICDDQLFVRPALLGHSLAEALELAPPYPGAKPHLLIPEARWSEREFLFELLRQTAAILPAPKAKRASKPRSASKPGPLE